MSDGVRSSWQCLTSGLHWPPCPPRTPAPQLEGENARLHRQNRIYERVLAVRDAMLQAFTSLHPTASEQLEQQQQQQQAAQQQQMQQLHLHQQRTAAAAAATPASSAAQGLVKALHELPSEREMDAAAAPAAAADAGAGAASQQQQKAQQAQQTQQPLVIQPDQPVPQSLLAEQHRSGSAAQLDGSALQKVENIPPAHDMAIRAMVAAMQEPEELVRGQSGRGVPACQAAAGSCGQRFGCS